MQVPLLANGFVAVYPSPDPERVYAYTFGLVRLDGGRLVAHGDSPKQARHYASMCFDGDDLHVLSRSGDHRARSAHDGNLITLHTVKGFRGLAYDLV